MFPLLSIKISKEKNDPKIDIFLLENKKLQNYDELELTLSYYPYSKQIDADSFQFDPYEDYVFDIAACRRSTYQPINDIAPQVFGLLIGGTILGYFWFFFPALLISIESTVSIFAAYTVAKEIWSDVDAFLQDVSKSWRVRWEQQSFFYVLQQFGTLQRFWQLARQKRYNYTLLLPTKIDFVSHSNSKTVEMLFGRQEIKQMATKKVRVLSISFNNSVKRSDDLTNGLVITRVALIKKFLGIRYDEEFYQSLNQRKIGTIDRENKWWEGRSWKKVILRLGRVFFLIKGQDMMKVSVLNMSD